MHACIHTYTHACMYTYIHTHIQTYTHIHTNIYTHTHKHIQTLICTYIKCTENFSSLIITITTRSLQVTPDTLTAHTHCTKAVTSSQICNSTPITVKQIRWTRTAVLQRGKEHCICGGIRRYAARCRPLYRAQPRVEEKMQTHCTYNKKAGLYVLLGNSLCPLRNFDFANDRY